MVFQGFTPRKQHSYAEFHQSRKLNGKKRDSLPRSRKAETAQADLSFSKTDNSNSLNVAMSGTHTPPICIERFTEGVKTLNLIQLVYLSLCSRESLTSCCETLLHPHFSSNVDAVGSVKNREKSILLTPCTSTEMIFALKCFCLVFTCVS